MIASNSVLYSDASVDIEKLSSNNGALGFEIERTGHESTRNVSLLDSVPSPHSPLWTFRANTPYIVKESENKLELSMQVSPILGGYIECGTLVNLAIDSYSTLIYYSMISVEHGVIEATLKVSSAGYPNLNHILSENLTLAAGDCGRIVIDDALADFQNQVEASFFQTWVSLRIETSSDAQFSIWNVNVHASTAQNLSSLVFDIRSPDGMPLSESGYTKYMYDYPVVNLTSLMTNESRRFMLYYGTGKVFLSPGNYSIAAAWKSVFRSDFHEHTLEELLISHITEISPHEEVNCLIRLPCSKLYVSITPNIPTIRVRIYSYFLNREWDEIYQIQKKPIPVDALFFIPTYPNTTEFRIWVSHDHHPLFRYLPPIPDISGELNLSTDCRVKITLSEASFMGILITPLEIFIVISSIGLILLITPAFYEFLKKSDTEILMSQPTFIPFLFLSLSIVLPWATYLDISSHFQGTQFVYYYVRNVPLASYLVWADGSAAVFMPDLSALTMVAHSESYYAVRNLSISFLLFWVPWMYLAIRSIWKRDLGSRYIDSIAIVIPMTNILFVLLQPGIVFASISYGVILVLASPITYFLLLAIQKYRPNLLIADENQLQQ
ncbi:hypothetical protein EU537_09875 [Candidatus Thorarchaeota archaeon]|nr:MAG: hypothetical protein EU537_09875 [Candidatus Thorarchaeota archaeon]